MALPPEIIDIIIDHLFDDKSALRASALVSHGWLPSARYHLFRKVRIKETNEDLEIWSQNVLRFLCCIPNAPAVVQELDLSGGFAVINALPEHPHTSSHFVDTLECMVEMLPSLKSLSVDSFNLYNPQLLKAPPVATHNLRSLSLYNIMIDKIYLQHLLSYLAPHIQAFTCNAFWVTDPVDGDAAEEESTYLQQVDMLDIEIRHPQPRCLDLDCLVASEDQLSSLHITLSSDECDQDIIREAVLYTGSFLRRKCQNLVYLRLDLDQLDLAVCDPGTLLELSQGITISACPRLRTLHIKIFTARYSDPFDTEEQWQYGVGILQTMPHSVKTFIFAMTVEPSISDDITVQGQLQEHFRLVEDQWNELDALLSQATHLSSVRIHGEVGGGTRLKPPKNRRVIPLKGALVEEIEKRLKHTQARGILEIVSVD